MGEMRANKSTIDQEIDTDAAWGHAGMIPEDLTKIRRIDARDEIDQATKGPPRFERVGRRHPTSRVCVCVGGWVWGGP